MLVPSWLRCENCLWYSFANEMFFYRTTDFEKQDVVGCINPDINPQLMSCIYRCPRWTCRRCLMSLDNIIANAPEVENHNHCEKVGRGKKNKSKNDCGFLNGENNILE